MDDTFKLYDLTVTVEGDPATFVCSHKIGPAFHVVGENIIYDKQTEGFSQYALAAILPLLPAKQRETHPHDWMTTDAFVRCPDPHCGATFKITRIKTTTFHHADVTKVPLDK